MKKSKIDFTPLGMVGFQLPGIVATGDGIKIENVVIEEATEDKPALCEMRVESSLDLLAVGAWRIAASFSDEMTKEQITGYQSELVLVLFDSTNDQIYVCRPWEILRTATPVELIAEPIGEEVSIPSYIDAQEDVTLQLTMTEVEDEKDST